MTEVTSRPQADDDRAGYRTGAGVVERRLADGRDAAFLRDLFAESRDDLHLLPPDTRDVIVDMQLRAQRRAWRLEHPHARHEVLVVRGVRAGHLVTAEDRATVHVVDLAVRPGLRGLGIGAAVLAELAADADRTRRTLQARVWTARYAARRLFERAGFAAGTQLAGYREMVRPPAE